MDHSPPKSARLNTVDTVKGIAIILMVFGHTEQGAMHRHLWDALPGVPPAITFANAFIYSFHMASFFFVAGLFLAGSVQRRGPRGFTFEKIRTVLYPYLLWAVLSALSGPLTAHFRIVTEPFSWRSFFSGILTGNASWFLITLFLCQLFALLVVRLPHWLQMALALAAGILVPVSDITVLFAPFLYFQFVVAGMWFSAGRMPILERLSKPVAAAGFVVLFALDLALIHFLGPVNRWDRLPVGLVGITMLLFLAQLLRATVGEKVLVWYGQGSLAVFVLAPFFQGIGREFVARVFHTTNPVPYLAVTTLVAATAPALVWSLQDRLRIAWLFRWPSARKAPTPANPQPIAG